MGKSTLLNALTSTERAIVSAIPGTTRDAVDEMIERDGQAYRFIDTAGIRRKGKTKLMAEKLSVVMARKHLEAADIALLVIDATEGVTAIDATIAGYAHESGRSLIIVVNKWDLVASRSNETALAAAATRPSSAPRARVPARDGHAPTRRPQGFRRAGSLRTEVSELRAGDLHLGERQAATSTGCSADSLRVGQERRKRVSTVGDEPLPRAHRFRPCLGPHIQARENLVHDAGGDVAADVHLCSSTAPSSCISPTNASWKTRSARSSVLRDADLDQRRGRDENRTPRIKLLRAKRRMRGTSVYQSLSLSVGVGMR